MKRIALLLVPAVVAFGTMACDDDPGSDWIPDTNVDMGVDTVSDVIPDPTADSIPDPTADTLPDTSTDTAVDTGTDSSGGPYGTLNVNFSSGYIFDGSRLSDSTYLSSHMEGLTLSGAFTGTYGSSGGAVPTPGAAQTVALAAHNVAAGTAPAHVMAIQQSQDATSVLNPIVQLYFPNDTITLTTYNVDVQTADDVLLVLMNSTGPTTGCALAAGIGGTVTVSTATGTTAEGGTLSFSGTAIPMYYPTDTPLGDISTVFTGSGLTICPIE